MLVKIEKPIRQHSDNHVRLKFSMETSTNEILLRLADVQGEMAALIQWDIVLPLKEKSGTQIHLCSPCYYSSILVTLSHVLLNQIPFSS